MNLTEPDHIILAALRAAQLCEHYYVDPDGDIAFEHHAATVQINRSGQTGIRIVSLRSLLRIGINVSDSIMHRVNETNLSLAFGALTVGRPLGGLHTLYFDYAVVVEEGDAAALSWAIREFAASADRFADEYRDFVGGENAAKFWIEAGPFTRVSL